MATCLGEISTWGRVGLALAVCVLQARSASGDRAVDGEVRDAFEAVFEPLLTNPRKIEASFRSGGENKTEAWSMVKQDRNMLFTGDDGRTVIIIRDDRSYRLRKQDRMSVYTVTMNSNGSLLDDSQISMRSFFSYYKVILFIEEYVYYQYLLPLLQGDSKYKLEEFHANKPDFSAKLRVERNELESLPGPFFVQISTVGGKIDKIDSTFSNGRRWELKYERNRDGQLTRVINSSFTKDELDGHTIVDITSVDPRFQPKPDTFRLSQFGLSEPGFNFPPLVFVALIVGAVSITLLLAFRRITHALRGASPRTDKLS